jgi:hypothetical protein
LPGFRFEAQPPPLAEALPRMDVALFVGFAESGPLDRPVALEDAAQFASIFGGDVPLAWDAQRGETVHAYLAPAVRAFFRNGGRRCWVVRVAGPARSNKFPIAGLTRQGCDGGLTPALAQASSKGSWSDRLQVSATLLSRPLRLIRIASIEEIYLELDSPGELVPGDVLRFTCIIGFMALLLVEEVTPLISDADDGFEGAQASGGRMAVRVRGGASQWFLYPLSHPGAQGRALLLTADGVRRTATATVPADVPWAQGSPGTANRPVTLDLELAPADAPALGSLLRVDFDGRWLWLRVDDARPLGGQESSDEVPMVRVNGEALWWFPGGSHTLFAARPTCEKLLFELRVRQGDADPLSIKDLGFTPRHPRFWGALPTDEELFGTGTGRDDDEALHRALIQAVARPRFPLAGRDAERDDALYFPVLMPGFSDNFLGPLKRRSMTLERDGLANFGADIFLDQQLRGIGTADLLTQADFLRYRSARLHQLRGIHAALDVEEATIIAVPDALHRGWTSNGEELIEPEPSAPRPHPEWWSFSDCSDAREIPLADQPQRGNFLDCELRIIQSPQLENPLSDARGRLSLSWTGEPEATYVLEESNARDWSGATQVYTGSERRAVIYGRDAGDYYYRVRALVGEYSSDWSNGVGVRVETEKRWRLEPANSYQAATMMEVQCALLRLCAARGDLLAVLALPEHYREEDAARHVVLIKPPARQGEMTGALETPLERLGYADARALSFGALYHPWLVNREEGLAEDWRRIPPDGTAAGIIAQRALTRGAWIAPANERMRDVVALAPPLGREYWSRLQEAQVNIVRQEARGFLSLSADTLSDEEELRPIGVRRLLSLLRRMALRLGATYVFEPNDDAFRRLVRRGFEGMLGQLFARGAFAGATPATAFQVVIDSTLNQSASQEQGRFILELKVAPSLPLTFLTIRLVQSGDRSILTEER